jgi:hypothetical protein
VIILLLWISCLFSSGWNRNTQRIGSKFDVVFESAKLQIGVLEVLFVEEHAPDDCGDGGCKHVAACQIHALLSHQLCADNKSRTQDAENNEVDDEGCIIYGRHLLC